MGVGGVAMTEIYIIVIMVLLVFNLILLLFLLGRASKSRDYQVEARLESFERNQEKTERLLREELAKNREENNGNSRLFREEMNNSFKMVSDMLLGRMAEIAGLQKSQLEVF